ncbi:MAG: dimethyl sulfoxide reductase anchor subunit family protein [Halocynthiibacter sp.]
MHPAPSVILFTVLSGLGFGLLGFLGLGIPAISGWIAFIYFFVAFALAVGGLLASAFHLGNPQRALMAFTQWRTSWLSREAWLSLLALLSMGGYALGLVFFDVRIAALGALGAALSLATVYATSMIYGQLKTVPRWNHWLTSAYFLALSLTGGALLAGQTTLAASLLLLTGALQIIVWVQGDTRFVARGHTLGTATGLGGRGALRQFEPPHTGTNYLLREMVYVVGRRHARKVRAMALVTMSLLPAFFLLLLPVTYLTAALALLSHLIGTAASRWLFFAEAEHVVGLYYDKR